MILPEKNESDRVGERDDMHACLSVCVCVCSRNRIACEHIASGSCNWFEENGNGQRKKLSNARNHQ